MARPVSTLFVVVLALFMPAPASGDGPTMEKETESKKTGSAEAGPAETALLAQRLRHRLLDPAPKDLDGRARGLLNSQAGDGSWPDVDYADESRTHWKPLRHLSYLETLARAYGLPGGVYEGDSAALEAVRSGLQYWAGQTPRSDNWWFNVIAAPRLLGNVLLLTAAALPPDLVESAAERVRESGFTRTGANLVDEAGNLLTLACATGDTALLRRAAEHIAGEVRVTADEGIQADDSFHQHGPQNMVISYGSGFAADQAGFAALFRGTSQAYSAERIRTLSRFILDGQQWFIWGRQIDYHAMGRGAFRGGKGAHAWNAGYFARIAGHMQEADPDRADEYRAFAARVTGQASAASSGPLGNKHFWRSDAMVQRRAGWYASVRFHSTRTYATETRTNRENLKGYHLADGVYFVLRRGDEYHQVQPVWDYRRLPGLTFLDTDAPLPYGRQAPKAGNTAFVGGVSDGRFGAAAMDYDKGGVKAKKAYFFSPEEMVCLGAGIRSQADERVLTTLNQCRLRAEVALWADGRRVPLETETAERGDVRAIHHDGIAYVLLDARRTGVSARMQQGSWRAVEESASDESVPQKIFSAWIDHGVRPQGASYAYRVVPGVGAERLGKALEAAAVEVLANAPELQAVHFAKYQTTQAVFHAPGSLELPGGGSIRPDKACTLIWRRVGESVLLSVAEPTQARRQLVLHLEGRYSGRGAGTLAGNRGTRLVVDLPQGQYAGRSVVIPLVPEGI